MALGSPGQKLYTGVAFEGRIVLIQEFIKYERGSPFSYFEQ